MPHQISRMSYFIFDSSNVGGVWVLKQNRNDASQHKYRHSNQTVATYENTEAKAHTTHIQSNSCIIYSICTHEKHERTAHFNVSFRNYANPNGTKRSSASRRRLVAPISSTSSMMWSEPDDVVVVGVVVISIISHTCVPRHRTMRQTDRCALLYTTVSYRVCALDVDDDDDDKCDNNRARKKYKWKKHIINDGNRLGSNGINQFRDCTFICTVICVSITD